MSLSIHNEHSGDIVVVRLVGRLDTVTSKLLEDHIAALLAKSQRRLVLDLAQVDYVSSYGLRVFLLNAKKLKEPRDGFVLCSVTPAVLKVLALSGFDGILKVCDTVSDGVEALRGSAGERRP